jgi:hypothetical protein
MNEAPAAPAPIPFEKGPPQRLETWLGLIHANNPRVLRRAVLAAAVGWLPLALLTLAHGDLWGSDRANAFALDFAACARFLIAAPLLVLAESWCAPRLRHIAREFVEEGLVSESDRAAYDRAVDSSRRLLHSRAAEVLAFVLAYALVVPMYLSVPAGTLSSWHGATVNGRYHFTPAGLWALLVSLPLLLVLVLGWLWRIALWARFLWLMSRLRLRLIPSHPDHAGGLKFVDASLLAAAPLGFAFGTLGAGIVLNQVVHHGASPLAYKYLALGVVLFVLALFVAPLLVFWPRLAAEHHRGVFAYGALARQMGAQLEAKWLGERPGDARPLEVQDFSATTDLYSITANVYAMSRIPAELRSLAVLAGATLLPFVPPTLMAVPLGVLVKTVSELFL